MNEIMNKLEDVIEQIADIRSEIGALEYQISLLKKDLRTLNFKKYEMILLRDINK